MHVFGVTPFVGVWIETFSTQVIVCVWWSHPSWVCGLKQYYYLEGQFAVASHTLRGCVD